MEEHWANFGGSEGQGHLRRERKIDLSYDSLFSCAKEEMGGIEGGLELWKPKKGLF